MRCGPGLRTIPAMIREKSNEKSKEKAKDAPARPARGVIAATPPSFRRERALIKRGVWPVAGCDEGAPYHEEPPRKEATRAGQRPTSRAVR